MAISGGSAGGYTTLACLAFKDVFKAGASHYGIGNLEMLASDTHKFESRCPAALPPPLLLCECARAGHVHWCGHSGQS